VGSDGRYSYERSLYLTVRGARAWWEGRFRDGDKVKSKGLGSATGDDGLSIRQAEKEWGKFRSKSADERAALLSTTAAAPLIRTPFAQARDAFLKSNLTARCATNNW
jgi:hypothetical protein